MTPTTWDGQRARPSAWLFAKSQRSAASLASMIAPHQDLFSFIHTGRKVRRPAVVWMKLLHQFAMGARNVARRRSLSKSEYFVSLVLGNRARPAPGPGVPRVTLTVRCLTPAGKAAIEIHLKQPCAVGIVSTAKSVKLQ